MKMYANKIKDASDDDVCLLRLNENMIRFLGFCPYVNTDLFIFSKRQTVKEAEFDPNINTFTPNALL